MLLDEFELGQLLALWRSQRDVQLTEFTGTLLNRDVFVAFHSLTEKSFGLANVQYSAPQSSNLNLYTTS